MNNLESYNQKTQKYYKNYNGFFFSFYNRQLIHLHSTKANPSRKTG